MTVEEELEKEIQDFKETNHGLALESIAKGKRVAELEKENAELKERLIKIENAYKRKFDAEWHLNDLYQKVLTDYANAEECSREYLAKYLTMEDRCIKAEEIIKGLIQLVDCLNDNNVKEPLVCKAEDFIKEVE